MNVPELLEIKSLSRPPCVPVVVLDLALAEFFVVAGEITGGKVYVLDVAEQTQLRNPLALAIRAVFAKQGMTFDSPSASLCIFADNLSKLGARIERNGNSLTISGPTTGGLAGAETDPQNDPFAGVALVVVALKVNGVRIRNAGCVVQSFPWFLDRIEWLRRVVIAIDGTSGSGKSTLARGLAKRLGFLHVDTGAMYRILAWQCLLRQQDCTDAVGVVRVMNSMRVEFKQSEGRIQMVAEGQDPGDAIREEPVNRNVSLVARIAEVRAWMVRKQRELLQFGSLVMEGRDIGSVVFADTPFKVYLDAHPEARAERRAREGFSDQLTRRDELDKTRAFSPLVVSSGSIIVDTSQNNAEQTMNLVLAEIQRRGL